MMARGVAAYEVVCALLRSERPEDAEPLAIRMAEETQRHARPDRPTLASVAGSLWLIAAVIASRQTDRDEAWRRLDQAQALADKIGEDGNFAWTGFGFTNVGIHRVDDDAVRDLTGAPPRVEFRDPDQPKQSGSTQAVVVCPATFNTVNKAAAGAADTYALAQLCSAMGEGLPLLVVPMVNNKLWGHPAWSRSPAILEGAGATMLDIHTGKVGAVAVQSGTSGDVVAAFDPGRVTNRLR